jgi:hypothetical protein
MIYEDESMDFCELLEEELAKSGTKAMEYCELCELQRENERMVADIMGVDMSEVKTKMKK